MIHKLYGRNWSKAAINTLLDSLLINSRGISRVSYCFYPYLTLGRSRARIQYLALRFFTVRAVRRKKLKKKIEPNLTLFDPSSPQYVNPWNPSQHHRNMKRRQPLRRQQKTFLQSPLFFLSKVSPFLITPMALDKSANAINSITSLDWKSFSRLSEALVSKSRPLEDPPKPLGTIVLWCSP